jgi:hypothetical protein
VVPQEFEPSDAPLRSRVSRHRQGPRTRSALHAVFLTCHCFSMSATSSVITRLEATSCTPRLCNSAKRYVPELLFGRY